MEILLIVLLTLINAFFAMAEIALTACRKVRLVIMAESGDKGAQTALKLLERPTQFLSTVQVGITCIAIFNAIMGDSAFGTNLFYFFHEFLHFNQKLAQALSTIIVVSIITSITVIFGELVPKRIAQLFPEQVARLTAKPMAFSTSLVKPFVHFFEISTFLILKLFRVEKSGHHLITEAEISAQLEEGVDAGVIEKHEHQMVRNVFHLDDRPLTSIMVPRADIKWLDAQLTVHQALLAATTTNRNSSAHPHGVYPVCKSSLDAVIGVLRLTRLLHADIDTNQTITQYVEPVVFVPETLNCMELVERFRAESTAMVMVVDEYGESQGLITPFDLLEAITGQLFQTEHDHAWATLLKEGTWLIDGLMPLEEFKTQLEIKKLPQAAKGKFNTVGGLMMALSGHLPEIGENIRCEKWTFIIHQLEGRRVAQILAHRLIEKEIGNEK